MSIWIEYLTAVVIAAFIAVTLFSVQMRSQEVSMDATQYRAARTTAADIIEMIESDLKNMGSQHPGTSSSGLYSFPGGATFGIIAAPDTASTTRTFRFYAQQERGTAPRTIQYQWTEVDSVTLSTGARLPVYDFTRTVDGVVDGRSTGILTRLTFNLLESPGNAITNLENTRQIFVEMRAITPLGEARTIKETRWTSTIRPAALTIEG
ncbi:hypothetical protein CRI94_15185 [Longibacter salinarum]|uniref:Prepilin-type cleavage/methylation domain-containing protein n=1 Tax=Longibacter salinarum TaxID=1850348 RepID=A0A2A8CUF2_9BACT|nr:hypothetical protein [Longibacter salinarum]PEN11380.1 hypothetical protein CRI94_15185 [Longibacter salinarum]